MDPHFTPQIRKGSDSLWRPERKRSCLKPADRTHDLGLSISHNACRLHVCQNTQGFDMRRVGEEIKGDDRLHLILLFERPDVFGKGRRIA